MFYSTDGGKMADHKMAEVDVQLKKTSSDEVFSC
jgi:hypothetical protein